MKVRLPNSKSQIKKIAHDTAVQAIKDKYESTYRTDIMRRLFKIMCLSLNELYGFGKKRNAQVLQWMTDLINEELEHYDNDVGDFWFKIDERLEAKDMKFFPTEDDIDHERRSKGE